MTTKTELLVLAWLAHGETGESSETMAFWLTWGIDRKDSSHPFDPVDFDRCLRLLEAAPYLRRRLHQMAALTPEWKSLVENWDEIEHAHLQEAGLGWTKGQESLAAYGLMRDALNRARANRRAAGKEPQR